MHVAHKVLAERYEEQDAQDSSEGRSQEYLHKRSGHLGILGLQNIDGWQGEDGSRHHGTRTGSDTLYDHILAQGLVALGGCAHTYGNNSDRDSSLEHLSYLQSKISRCRRKDDSHHNTPGYRPHIDLGISLVGTHQGFILLTVLQLAEGILGEIHFFFHRVKKIKYVLRIEYCRVEFISLS